MNGNRSELNSKRARKCNNDVDRISQLPDDVIVCILSSLPLKEAVATSLVSTRWSHLWRCTPNLVFKDPDCTRSQMSGAKLVVHGQNCHSLWRSLKTIQWANSAIDSHKALSLKRFTLDSYLHDFRFLPKWLRFALVSRRVEILKLNFHDSPSVFDITCLTGIQSSDYKFLKELTLENVFVRGEVIERFLQNSPMLERLILDVDLMSNLVRISGTFNHLELRARRSYKTSIKVSSPNLTCFKCDFDSCGLFVEDVPNLVDVSYALCGHGKPDTMDFLANSTSNLEILTLLLNAPKAFSIPQMSRLKKLYVDYEFVSRDFVVPITDFLQASPYLQEFRLKVSDIGFHYHCNFTDAEPIFEVPKLGKSPRHRHLDVFEFSGFYVPAPDHMELLRYIVDCCVALREIIVKPLLEIYYLRFEHELSIKYPDSNTTAYKVLPVSYGSNDGVVSNKDRERHLRIKKLTGRMIAGKVPRHIHLLIGHFVPFT